MTFKAAFLVSLIVLANACYGQATKVLRLKNHRNYSEENTFVFDSCFKLVQTVWYNVPNSIDEEYGLYLTLEIKDTIKAKQLKIINVKDDSAIIKCTWDWRSVWNWEDETTKVEGFIQIISWTTATVTAKFSINVFNYKSNRTLLYIYNGKRVFKKAKPITDDKKQ